MYAIRSYYDIHSHIIPAIDDGAGNEKAALDMMRIAALKGTSHIVATPHFISGQHEICSAMIHEKCERLQGLADSEGIKLTIYPGSEVFLSPDVPELFDKGSICTINDSSYIRITSYNVCYTKLLRETGDFQKPAPYICEYTKARDAFFRSD